MEYDEIPESLERLIAVAGQVQRPVGRLEPERCHAAKDGDCTDARCPQLRDGEPRATGRHCPLDHDDADDRWLDDEGTVCDLCGGDGMDPMTDYALECPACQGDRL